MAVAEQAAAASGSRGQAGAQHVDAAAAPPPTALAAVAAAAPPAATAPPASLQGVLVGADSSEMDINPFTLTFRTPSMEGQFLGEVAKRRWPVLMFVFLFDCITFTFRFAAKLAGSGGSGREPPGGPLGG